MSTFVKPKDIMARAGRFYGLLRLAEKEFGITRTYKGYSPDDAQKITEYIQRFWMEHAKYREQPKTTGAIAKEPAIAPATLSCHQISKTTGRDWHTVSKAIEALGIKKGPHGYTPNDVQKIIEFFNTMEIKNAKRIPTPEEAAQDIIERIIKNLGVKRWARYGPSGSNNNSIRVSHGIPKDHLSIRQIFVQIGEFRFRNSLSKINESLKLKPRRAGAAIYYSPADAQKLKNEILRIGQIHKHANKKFLTSSELSNIIISNGQKIEIPDLPPEPLPHTTVKRYDPVKIRKWLEKHHPGEDVYIVRLNRAIARIGKSNKAIKTKEDVRHEARSRAFDCALKAVTNPSLWDYAHELAGLSDNIKDGLNDVTACWLSYQAKQDSGREEYQKNKEELKELQAKTPEIQEYVDERILQLQKKWAKDKTKYRDNPDKLAYSNQIFIFGLRVCAILSKEAEKYQADHERIQFLSESIFAYERLEEEKQSIKTEYLNRPWPFADPSISNTD